MEEEREQTRVCRGKEESASVMAWQGTICGIVAKEQPARSVRKRGGLKEI